MASGTAPMTIEDRERVDEIRVIGALGERRGLVVRRTRRAPQVGGATPLPPGLDGERMPVVRRHLDVVAGAAQQVGQLGAERASR